MIYAFRSRRNVIVVEADSADDAREMIKGWAEPTTHVDLEHIAVSTLMVLANHDEHEEVYVMEPKC